MSETVLVVIDVQNIMFETPGMPPFEGERVLETIAGLIASARDNGVPVHYVQHTTEGVGSEFEADSHNWLFHPAIAPKPGDTVSRKHSYDAFWNTDFEAILDKLGARKLVFCGLQTECCVDTTVRSALAHGFESILAADGHSTYDKEFVTARTIIDLHNDVLHRRFCTVMKAADIKF
jgi:nicotinamidase-related amidase